MVKSNTQLHEKFTFQQLMQLEVLIAVAVPTVAILIMGVVGTWHVGNTQAVYFAVIFLACAVAVFFCERAIVLRMHQAMNEQINAVTMVCREFMRGEKDQRVQVLGDDTLATLALTVNMLLDQQEDVLNTENEAEQQLSLLEKRLEQLMLELRPVFDGDLCVRAEVPEGNIGVVSDACNALIEKLVQFARWALYMSGQVIETSRVALTRAIDAAQATEIQKQRLLQTTRLIATMSAAVQRMSSTLDVSVGIADLAEKYFQQQKQPVDESTRLLFSLTPQSRIQMDQLIEDTRWQRKMLGEALRAIEETATMAGNVVDDMGSLGQQMQQSSLNMVKTVEHINTLVALAEEWRVLIEALNLPAEEREEEKRSRPSGHKSLSHLYQEEEDYMEDERSYSETAFQVPLSVSRKRRPTH